MGSLLVVTGPPGAGKSTVARILADRFEPSVLVEGNSFPRSWCNPTDPWFLPTFATATGLTCLHYLVLLPSLQRCIGRVGTRQGHGFTDEAATRTMHRNFARTDVDRRYLLLDPPTNPRTSQTSSSQHSPAGRWHTHSPPSRSTALLE